MSEDDIAPIQGPSADARIQEAQKAHAKQQLSNMVAKQVETQEDFPSLASEALFNPPKMRKKFEKLEERKAPPRDEKASKSEAQKETDVKQPSSAETIAESYFKRNPELNKNTLLILRDQITDDDTPDTILEKLQKIFTDQSLADEAIDYLIEVAETRKEMRRKLTEAKERFNASFGREIKAGRNIAAEARNFSKQGLGSPTGLRDLYRDVTSTQRNPHELFDELMEQFEFSKMKNILDFILHSLGADLKSKGPSISKGELQRLFGETRNMQAILGVFRFFFARMDTIKGQFDRYDLTMPSRISFEVLARLLMKLIQERYPSPDKILKLAFVLGISEELAAQIVIFSHYRDAMRHLSPKLFKSERHRQDLLLTFIETLTDLEDDFEDEEEEHPPKRSTPKDSME